MNYRREIDGLRALAILPVIFFHAGFHAFSGGFVGVDIFFVISGYLITSIILFDMQNENFNLINFYERRARRILPALFLVMAISSIFAYAWLLPDELKNFGQSIVATTLFSNNILLAITSNYWSLASEFKPLLHTWSLGVEEQYYIIFPFFLILGWRYFKKHLVILLSVTGLCSLALASWGAFNLPDLNFYLLPTRAWEILIGSLVAFYLNKQKQTGVSFRTEQILSTLGFFLIIFSVFAFDQNQPSPSFYTLVPTLGAAFIILFATKNTVSGRVLGSKFMVGFGLISYSSYLWHQPLFAFARVYGIAPPSLTTNTSLLLLTFVLAGLTWKYIETPFRNKEKFNRNSIFLWAIIASIIFVAFGLYLHKSYGILSRIYDINKVKIADIDKTIYNEKVFLFKKDNFTTKTKLKLLIIGNSFGRDFVNMTEETFDLKNIEIVYRDDIDKECIFPFKNDLNKNLYGSADMIIFASDGINKKCVTSNISYAEKLNKNIFYVGSKYFGYNLNWLIRLNIDERRNQFNPLLPETSEQEKLLSNMVPIKNYISLLAPIIKNDYIPITDESGRLISVDRRHLTKFGAIYIGQRALLKSKYGIILNQYKGTL